MQNRIERPVPNFAAAIGVLAALAALAVAPASALDSLVVGETGRDWSAGGGGITPSFALDKKEAGSGNTPGAVVEFDSQPGWVFPRRVDSSINLAFGAAERGGGAGSPLPSIADDELAAVIDADPLTAFRRKAAAGQLLQVLGIIIDVDLGARFGVNRVRIYPRNSVHDSPSFPFQGDFIRGYEIALNNGLEATQVGGRPVFTSLVREPQNVDNVVDLAVPLQFVRHIRVTSLTTVGFEIDEIEVYGAGFVPEAAYLSDVYDVCDVFATCSSANWGNLWWREGKEGVGGLSDLSVSTRSGRDATPLLFTRRRADGNFVPWKAGSVASNVDLDLVSISAATDIFNSLSLDERAGLELTFSDYDRLSEGDRGELQDDQVNWSPWSAPYPATARDEGGTAVLSPGPRRYFQFRLDFTSDDVAAATGVDQLGFEMSPALAVGIVAEIQPREIRAGESTDFTYGVRAEMTPANPGFDRFEVTTGSRVDGIKRVEVVDHNGDVVQAEEFPALEGLTLPYSQGAFAIDKVDAQSFVVGFPEVTEDGHGLRIHFTASALRFGQTFSGRAFSSVPERIDELAQLAVPGNAGSLGPDDMDVRLPGTEDLTAVDNSLSVRVNLGGRFVGSVRASPPAFTPNGDGVNERVSIEFQVFRLGLPAPLRVEIYDLGGRLCATVLDGARASGQFSADWDGRDASGELVAPGIYLVNVVLDTDVSTETSIGLVSVVY